MAEKGIPGMKINIPKVVRPIRLSDYAPEFGEQQVEMWVNPPREKRLAFASISERFQGVREQIAKTEDPDVLAALMEDIKALGLEMYAWWADMWSEGEDEWTGEEVQTLVEAALNSDPGLWDFLQEQSLDAMQDYRNRKKAD